MPPPKAGLAGSVCCGVGGPRDLALPPRGAALPASVVRCGCQQSPGEARRGLAIEEVVTVFRRKGQGTPTGPRGEAPGTGRGQGDRPGGF